MTRSAYDSLSRRFRPQGDLGDYQLRSEQGNPNGYPDLDENGKVPLAQLPSLASESPSVFGIAVPVGCRFVWSNVSQVSLIPSGADGKAAVPVVDPFGSYQVLEIVAPLAFVLPTHLDTGLLETGATGYALHIQADSTGVYRPRIAVSGTAPQVDPMFPFCSAALHFISNSQGAGSADVAKFTHGPNGEVQYNVPSSGSGGIVAGVVVLSNYANAAVVAVNLTKAVPNVPGCAFWMQVRANNSPETSLSTFSLFRTSAGADEDRLFHTNLNSDGPHRSNERIYIPHQLIATPATSLYAEWSANTGNNQASIGIVSFNLGVTWGQSVAVAALENGNGGGGGSGSVTSISVGTGLVATPGTPITTSGTISHDESDVVPGTYSSVTVDELGHVTAGSDPLDGLDSDDFLRSNVNDHVTDGAAITFDAGTLLDVLGTADFHSAEFVNFPSGDSTMSGGGHNTGLDADKLDGAHASAFAQVSGGQIDGTSSHPTIIGIRETSGPTELTLGAVADGQVLKRVGSTLVGAAPSAGSISIPDGHDVSALPNVISHWKYLATTQGGTSMVDELGNHNATASITIRSAGSPFYSTAQRIVTNNLFTLANPSTLVTEARDASCYFMCWIALDFMFADSIVFNIGGSGETAATNVLFQLNINSGATSHQPHLFWEQGAGLDVDITFRTIAGGIRHLCVAREHNTGTGTSTAHLWIDGVLVDSQAGKTNPTSGTSATGSICPAPGQWVYVSDCVWGSGGIPTTAQVKAQWARGLGIY